jgi:hypothetical protein
MATNEQEPTILEVLTYQMQHDRPENRTTAQAIAVVEELNDWLDNIEGRSVMAEAYVTIARRTISVSIGDFHLWEDQCCSEDELTFEGIRARYLEELTALMVPFNPPNCGK